MADLEVQVVGKLNEVTRGAKTEKSYDVLGLSFFNILEVANECPFSTPWSRINSCLLAKCAIH